MGKRGQLMRFFHAVLGFLKLKKSPSPPSPSSSSSSSSSSVPSASPSNSPSVHSDRLRRPATPFPRRSSDNSDPRTDDDESLSDYEPPRDETTAAWGVAFREDHYVMDQMIQTFTIVLVRMRSDHVPDGSSSPEDTSSSNDGTSAASLSGARATAQDDDSTGAGAADALGSRDNEPDGSSGSDDASAASLRGADAARARHDYARSTDMADARDGSGREPDGSSGSDGTSAASLPPGADAARANARYRATALDDYATRATREGSDRWPGWSSIPDETPTAYFLSGCAPCANVLDYVTAHDDGTARDDYATMAGTTADARGRRDREPRVTRRRDEGPRRGAHYNARVTTARDWATARDDYATTTAGAATEREPRVTRSRRRRRRDEAQDRGVHQHARGAAQDRGVHQHARGAAQDRAARADVSERRERQSRERESRGPCERLGQMRRICGCGARRHNDRARRERHRPAATYFDAQRAIAPDADGQWPPAHPLRRCSLHNGLNTLPQQPERPQLQHRGAERLDDAARSQRYGPAGRPRYDWWPQRYGPAGQRGDDGRSRRHRPEHGSRRDARPHADHVHYENVAVATGSALVYFWRPRSRPISLPLPQFPANSRIEYWVIGPNGELHIKRMENEWY